MRARIKRIRDDKTLRLEGFGDIKEVLINEDITSPNNEIVSICFKGEVSSGIIDFTPEEMEDIMSTVKSRMRLVKGVKRIVD